VSSAALAFTDKSGPTKSAEAFRTISEVADELDVPQHVLRFWESRFTQIKPVKRAGGRRYYRPDDVDLLKGIRALLYSDGLTIKGVQKVLKERGLRHVAQIGRGGSAEVQPPEPRIIEKIVYVEKPAEAPVKKKSRAHLRAVPMSPSLPFFDAPHEVPVQNFPTVDIALFAEPEAESAPAAAPEIAPVQAAVQTPDIDRPRLEEILDALLGMKERLRAARA
jgi:DNA-binding transcriptional MerR regulator